MLKILVCVSGGGTNLQALIDSMQDGRVTNTEITCVFSNNRNAYGLTRAKEAGIDTACLSPKEFEDRADFNAAFLDCVKGYEPDLIVLAGFLVAIPPAMIQAYQGRIINIHPSLIPSFCGVGYYGLKVHEAVLDRGVKVTGSTVHFVDEGTDTGPILLQKSVKVEPFDTPETLQRRVMEQAEWILLPQAVDMIANGNVRMERGKVIIS